MFVGSQQIMFWADLSDSALLPHGLLASYFLPINLCRENDIKEILKRLQLGLAHKNIILVNKNWKYESGDPQTSI